MSTSEMKVAQKIKKSKTGTKKKNAEKYRQAKYKEARRGCRARKEI